MEYDKWIPGEGIILADDNPYKNMINIERLVEYTGNYEMSDGQKVELKINENEKLLYALINGMKHPLYFIEENIFEDISRNKIAFKRNEKNNIISFKYSGDKENLYKKVNTAYINY